MIETVRLRSLNSRRSSSGCFGLNDQKTNAPISRMPIAAGIRTFPVSDGALRHAGHAVEQRGETRRQQDHADDVERLARLGGVLGQDPPRVDQADQADRQVDQEDPVPRSSVDQDAAEDRTHDRAEQHRDAEDRHEAAHAVRAGGLGHDRHAERHQHAAAEALEHPEADEGFDVPRRRAQQRSDREQRDRRHVEALGAEPVGRPAGERDDRREREHVGRGGPRDGRVGERLVAARQLGLERRQCDVDDRDVEDRHDGAEHDDAGDLEELGCDLVAVVDLSRWGSHTQSPSGCAGAGCRRRGWC